MMGDDPIGSDGDLLGRRSIARRWAGTIREAESPSGLVFAITGPWGSGKTSMLTMIEEELVSNAVEVLHFNPWLFSGTDQLVTYFFGEIAGQIGQTGDEKKQKVANSLRKYGTYLTPIKAIPVIGTALGGAAQGAAAIGDYLENALNRGIGERRKDLEEGLRELSRPLVVVIDDIDRLTGQEIRDILRMVRLTAAFPNVIYLLSFDRQRVELALQEDGIPGRAYLEKIVQVMFDVPLISRSSLQKILFDQLGLALADFDDLRFNVGLWHDVYPEIIDPLLTNIRDVRRYVAPLRAVMGALNNDVELVDVLALEAVRIFLPDSFAALGRSVECLTSASDYSDDHGNLLKSQLESFLESDPHNSAVLKQLCIRLFPATSRYIAGPRYGSDWERVWLRERRVASGPVLTYYLEKAMPDAVLNANRAEEAFAVIEDGVAFEALLDELEPDEAEAAIAALENHESEFGSLNPAPAVTILLNQLPRLERPAKGMFDIGPSIVIARVVLRLLRQLGNEDSVATVVDEVLPNLRTFSATFELLRTVGHKLDSDRRLLSAEVTEKITAELKAKIRRAGPDELAAEPKVLRLLVWASTEGETSAWVLPESHLDDPAFSAALLLSAADFVHSRSMNSRYEVKQVSLAWEPLSSIAGGEAGIRRLRASALSALEDDSAILSVVDQYLAGWRPSDRSA